MTLPDAVLAVATAAALVGATWREERRVAAAAEAAPVRECRVDGDCPAERPQCRQGACRAVSKAPAAAPGGAP